ncbi:MAG: Eco57I restriction-modification methylase domain-containing protein [Gemmatimonadaceae bacterium]
MKGFVPTPAHIVDAMVAKLFRKESPQPGQTVLDPGCGTGAFIQGIIRWCERKDEPRPQLIGVDSDPALLEIARQNVGHVEEVTLLHDDFLKPRSETYDYIVGNPPYVPITGLSVEERDTYRQHYNGARGRFDLYLLFFERALKVLRPQGRLVFITPEKFLYVQTAEFLRRDLARVAVEEIEFIDESAFGELVTYPTITTITAGSPGKETQVRLRDGSRKTIRLNTDGSSWLPMIHGTMKRDRGPTLTDAFVRISCGVATGADSVFVLPDRDVPRSLRPFAFPTLAGRSLKLGEEVRTTHSMLIPYARNGALLSEEDLGLLGEYLRAEARRSRLMQRTCVLRKPWYAFHENPPLTDMLRPKILCKDISAMPGFVVAEDSEIVPRHSVYYLVPTDPSMVHDLCAYLNSQVVLEWLTANCQRAAKGFVRLQSHVLKRVPLPAEFTSTPQLEYA